MMVARRAAAARPSPVRPLVEPDFVLAPGPAANAATVEQLANRKADMAPPARTKDSDA